MAALRAEPQGSTKASVRRTAGKRRQFSVQIGLGEKRIRDALVAS
jgi:hypothetical protein